METQTTKGNQAVRQAFKLAGHQVAPGTAETISLEIAKRYTAADVALPVRVVHGKYDGPVLFVTAAIHGDEINGVEIVRRLVQSSRLKRLRGTLLAVPVVNIYGFLQHSRYLPDRRDLNRSFPGSGRGSLAARLADALMHNVIERASAGIDLHTGALHRNNLPQIRAQLDDPTTLRMAEAFGAPVMLDSRLRDGSLRAVAAEQGIPILLYEGGQALRFDEVAIRAGLRGVLSVMEMLEMLPPGKRPRPRKTYRANGSTWVRAPESGVLRNRVALGAAVTGDQALGTIADPMGLDPVPVEAPREGIVIGISQLPLVNEGDALYHIAHFDRLEHVASHVDGLAQGLQESDFSGHPEPITETNPPPSNE
jgi:predicted deacylase